MRRVIISRWTPSRRGALFAAGLVSVASLLGAYVTIRYYGHAVFLWRRGSVAVGWGPFQVFATFRLRLMAPPQYPRKLAWPSFWILPPSGLLPITRCTAMAYGNVKLSREIAAFQILDERNHALLGALVL
ncbi:MAG: hypothetical protein M1272_00815 [Firmicutes bacterium]|nr:hypothetical protein [Bacillota bacterium]